MQKLVKVTLPTQ